MLCLPTGDAQSVEIATQVCAAIERCLAEDYDVVLMDIEMPDMDGITASGLIREKLPAERHPYIVALTANAMASERETYLGAGMDGYLSKPLDVDDGGAFHRGKSMYGGRDVFTTRSDLGFQKIDAWLRGADSSQGCTPSEEVGP